MIKSSVCFLPSDPEREKHHVPAEHRRANCLVLFSSPERNVFFCVRVCEYACVCTLRVCCYCFTPPIFSSSSHSSLPSGATGCYLELSLMCAVTLAAAGGRNETGAHTHSGLKITGPLLGICIPSSSSLSTVSSSLPRHLSSLYPTRGALQALSSGKVAWSYIIHGSCDLRCVSYGRSNNMEYR